MKRIAEGLESSGKSLLLAKWAYQVVDRNAYWFKKTAVPRPIRPNFPFSTPFIERAAKKGVPIIQWRNLREIVGCEESDIFCDEIGKYFDSRLWPDLSVDCRHWLPQCEKMGTYFYGATQDFSMVDKSFRLLCKEIYFVSKLMGSPRPMKTRPTVKRIWGLCGVHQYDPRTYKDGERGERITLLPKFVLIRKKWTDAFDTNFRFIRSDELPLEHVERRCYRKDCNHIRIAHR